MSFAVLRFNSPWYPGSMNTVGVACGGGSGLSGKCLQAASGNKTQLLAVFCAKYHLKAVFYGFFLIVYSFRSVGQASGVACCSHTTPAAIS